MGGGALVGAWLLERLHGRGLPRHRALPIATLTFSAGLAVVALTPWLWLGLAGMAFSGAFWIWMFAATNTAIQLRSPRSLLGRMLGLYQLSVIGPIAIGSTVAGAIAEEAGIVATLGLRRPARAVGPGACGTRSRPSTAGAGRTGRPRRAPAGTRPTTETK